MDMILRCCAGLDVHKKTVVACVRTLRDDGTAAIRKGTFPTDTAGLLELGDWLVELGVEHAAMESTGVYWKPVWNLLEGRVGSLMLVNARLFRNVPGRKTDTNDAQWLAQLLQHGLLRASFVPPRPMRELRDLTRQRTCLVQDKTRVANRIQKVLEDANIKLASVASDVLGVSGRAMIRALIDGQKDPTILADLAKLRLRAKLPELRRALRGGVTEHHRYMLGQYMKQLRQIEELIADLQARIDTCTAKDEAIIHQLDGIPGVDRRTAQIILAEVGTDMSHFPSAGHLASWAKLRPGDNESAGKQRSSHVGHGNRWLRGAMTQCAWAAGRTKKSYFSAHYKRIMRRRGKKRALVAVANSLMVVIYHMLKNGTEFHDLGPDYLDRLEPDRLAGMLVKRLEKLGHQVTLSPSQNAA